MADDDLGGCIGAMFLLALGILALMAVISVGSLFGAGVALKNYAEALQKNVRPERGRS